MRQRGVGGWSPVARFSVALALVLAVTAVALGGLTAFLIGRYVEDETVTFTQDTVAGHFGTVFQTSIFQRPLTPAEAQALKQTVIFHFSIYSIVATRFYATDGTIVFSYDAGDLGRRLDPIEVPSLGAALAGQRVSTHRTIVADVRYARPGFTYAEANGDKPPPLDHSGHAVGLTAPDVRNVQALESWVPVVTSDGTVIGAVTVWRDIEPLNLALRNMQAGVGLVIAAAAMLLWLILRGVYQRSSKQIVAHASALRRALAENERAYDATLAALSSALDVRDTETEGHARRVVRYMELIADGLGVPVDQHATLRRGALLHDIGKIGVPDHILRKPGPLSENEWYTMKTHPDLGARIIANVPFLEEVAVIIRAHHERWDGNGYPEGLAGEQIPLGARIFAVADSFDAMTSDRPYRRGRHLDEALAEIERCAGTQFD
ncbi:MAG TPA: HD-GYP domain-containing protein, partial [Candidatus Limnocylindria bacterium]|nr:HD-GYP domain-containing protein [Candidatus Limnocylindria bacterium]